MVLLNNLSTQCNVRMISYWIFTSGEKTADDKNYNGLEMARTPLTLPFTSFASRLTSHDQLRANLLLVVATGNAAFAGLSALS